MGNRWSRWWQEQFKTYPIGSNPTEGIASPDLIPSLFEHYRGTSIVAGLHADRFLVKFPRDAQLRVLAETLQRAEAAILTAKPDVYFSTGVAYMYNLATLAVCKKHLVPHVSLYDTRGSTSRLTVSLGNGATWELVDRDFHRFRQSPDLIPANVIAAARVQLKNFRETKPAPRYMQFKRHRPSIHSFQITEFFKRLRYWYFEGWGSAADDYLTQHPLFYVRRDLTRIARAWLFRQLRYPFDVPNQIDRYYLFPIHLQPETTTLIWAEWYVNQLESIRNISKALPTGYFLYVKEHPSAFGYNPRDFYREVQRLPNVKLISPYENSLQLVSQSVGVITLTSTMGWEAIFLRKPVFLLGNVFYGALPGVNHIHGFEQLRSVLRDEAGYQRVSDSDIHYYLSAVQLNSFQGLFDVAKLDTRNVVLSPQNVSSVYSAIRSLMDKARGTVGKTGGIQSWLDEADRQSADSSH